MLEKLLTDRHIAQRVLRGRTQDFRILIDRYGGMLYAFAYAHLGNASDAEDAAQEAFLRLYQWLDRLSSESTMGPWLVKVTRNLVTDFMRRRASERMAIDHYNQARQTEPCDFAQQELHAALWSQIANLEAEHREILILSYFRGQRAKDIAALLDISPEAAAKRLQRAREELGRRLISSVGAEVISRKPDHARSARIMSAIAITPVPWKAGISISVAGAAVVGSTATKLIAAIATAGAVSALTCFFLFGGPARFFQHTQDITGPSQFTVHDLPAPPPSQLAPPSSAKQPENSQPPATLVQKEQDSAAIVPEPDFYSMLNGIVVDATGKPVSNAEVGIDNAAGIESATHRGQLTDLDAPARKLHLATAADQGGYFHFDNIPTGLKAGIADDVIWAKAGNLYGEHSIRLNGPARERYIELVLKPAFSIAGMVIDDKGAPVGGADVLARQDSQDEGYSSVSWFRRYATTDDAGRFVLQHLPGGSLTLYVSAKGYLPEKTKASTTGTADIVIRVSTGCTISGSAIASDRSPATGFRVNARSIEGNKDPDGKWSPFSESQADVNENGTFLVSGLKPGDYDLTLLREPKVPIRYALREPVRVSVQKNRPATGVELRLTNGAQISGRVMNDRGMGLSDAVVSVATMEAAASTKSDADGAYVLNGVPDGEVKIVAKKDAYEQAEKTIPKLDAGTSMKGIDLQLTQLPVVTGMVVDSSHRPVPGASVIGRATEGKAEFATVSDTEGKFALPVSRDLPAIYLQALADIGISSRLGPVEPFAQEYELLLHSTGYLEGEVITAAGAPMAHMLVDALPSDSSANQLLESIHPVLRSSDAPTHIRMTTDSRGCFVSGPMLPGAYELEILQDWATGGPLAVAHTVVQEGRTVHAHLVVDTSDYGAIEGVVTGNGRPLQGVFVQANNFNYCGQVTTDIDGRYYLHTIPPGQVPVEFITLDLDNTGRMDTRTETVDVTAGETSTLNLELNTSGTMLEGHALINGERPIGNYISIHIVALDAEGEREILALFADSEGRFFTDQLPEGHYRLTADVPDKDVRQTTEIDIKAGETAQCDFDLQFSPVVGTITGLRPGERAGVALLSGSLDPSQLPPLDEDFFNNNVLSSRELRADQPLNMQVAPGTYYLGAVAIPEGQPMDSANILEAIGTGRYTIISVQVVPGQPTPIDVQLP